MLNLICINSVEKELLTIKLQAFLSMLAVAGEMKIWNRIESTEQMPNKNHQKNAITKAIIQIN